MNQTAERTDGRIVARLQKASALLREMASGAEPGPWEDHHDPISTDVMVLRISEDDDDHGAEVALCNRMLDAAYIATMHSGVGLALADWLGFAAIEGIYAVGIDYAVSVCDALGIE